MSFGSKLTSAFFLALAGAALACSLPAAAQDRTASPDWITATNQNCKIWNPEPQPNESVTWSGGCKDGLASGKGVLRWTEDGKPDAVFEGEYANGKRNGAGVLTLPDGRREAGTWANDEPVQSPRDAI
jgi:hypothetical protein